jgi:hypothetical protein
MQDWCGPCWAECYDKDNQRYYKASIIEFDGYYNGMPHYTQRPMTSEEVEEHGMTKPPEIPHQRHRDAGNGSPV